MCNCYNKIKFSSKNGIEMSSKKGTKFLNDKEKACLGTFNEWWYWKHARNIFLLYKLKKYLSDIQT